MLERLHRLDSRSGGKPWTRRILQVLASHPGVRAQELCRLVDQETDQFKRNVRKLKSLGLTESLATGYRLSPRGAALLADSRIEDWMPSISFDLQQQVARAMEADVRLLPVLPLLLADLWELGTSAEMIVSALGSAGVLPGSAVLDLGCGKGAVAVALAERLDLRVEGVDAFPPFVEAARVLAAQRGVGLQCLFRQADIRRLMGTDGDYDAVLLLSVGPVSGDHRKTISDLRTLVRPGGCIVIEDGFLADGVASLPGCEGYANHLDTVRRLTGCGDKLLREIVCSPSETRSTNERNTALIRRRADRLKANRPDMADVIDAYVARQERETEILGSQLICAVWVLRRIEQGQLP